MFGNLLFFLSPQKNSVRKKWPETDGPAAPIQPENFGGCSQLFPVPQRLTNAQSFEEFLPDFMCILTKCQLEDHFYEETRLNHNLHVQLSFTITK